jgi:hypothetical protein
LTSSLANNGGELARPLQLVGRPGPRLAAVDIQGPHRLCGEADGHAQDREHAQLADHGGEPDPDGRGSQVLDHHRPILGEGLQVGAFAEVVLDLGQQLHGGVGGGHPAGWAVSMNQGEAGPVDLQDGPGGLGDPEQAAQQVIGLGQRRSELLDGPGDHCTINSHSVVPRGDGDVQGMLPPPGRMKQRDVAADQAASRPRQGPLVVPVAGRLSGGW